MSSISGFMGPEQLPECLKGCEVVVIPAGVPRKPGRFSLLESPRAGLKWVSAAVLLKQSCVCWGVSDLLMPLPQSSLCYQAAPSASLRLSLGKWAKLISGVLTWG